MRFEFGRCIKLSVSRQLISSGDYVSWVNGGGCDRKSVRLKDLSRYPPTYAVATPIAIINMNQGFLGKPNQNFGYHKVMGSIVWATYTQSVHTHTLPCMHDRHIENEYAISELSAKLPIHFSRWLNEPFCYVATESTDAEQTNWWPSRTSDQPLKEPPKTTNTVQRSDFKRSAPAEGNTRHGSNPFTIPAKGIC